MTNPLVMGVLNITPDSFSDGGELQSIELAAARAKQLIADGAKILDVGGESTRPGADRVPIQEEINRVAPVIEAICDLGAEISVDTMNSETAAVAVAAGAKIINDVSGGKNDPRIFKVAAETGAKLIISHWRGHSREMDKLNQYESIGQDVAKELGNQVRQALEAGVTESQIIVDPGLGFAKDVEQNWELLENLDPLFAMGFPVLIGASRKRFIAARLEPGSSNEAKDEATGELMRSLSEKYSLWGVRVHNVRATISRQN
jgi:dihydropteroate synthase